MSPRVSSRELKRIESVFGEAYLDLPWTTAAEARGALDDAAQRATRRFEERLDGSWRTEAPWREAVYALADLFPDDFVGSYGGRFAHGSPIGIMNNGGDGHPMLGVPPYMNAEAIRVGRFYGPDRPAVLPDRPVSFAALAPHLGSAAAAIRMLGTGYPSPEVGNQLRTVLTSPGDTHPQITCMVFILRRRRQGFSLEEQQRLFAAQAALRRWHTHSEALGREPFSGAGLPVALLDAFDLPAVVLHHDRVVHGNRAARHAEALPLDAAPLRALATSRQPFVAEGGREYELLVLPRSVGRVSLRRLSPALREVALLLARGDSDKEIAVALDRPLSTVRTYTRRIFRQLGVHGRRELMQLHGEDCPG